MKDRTISRHFIIALALLLTLVSTDAHADSVITSDSVESFVNIRAQPDITSAVIAVLRRGRSAPYRGEAGDWYTVGLADESVGYVSRNWTERIVTAAPDTTDTPDLAVVAPAPGPDTGPGKDRTLLRDAAAAMRGGDPDGAYARLKAQESAWAGDAGYDYLLGLAALDSGRAGEAVMALRRISSSLPGFSGARLELARAYYDSGDCDSARPMFSDLLDEQPEPQVATVLEAYVAACTPRPASQTPAGGLYFAVDAGYDSNANGATDTTTFLGFELDGRTVERDSEYVALAGGWTGQRELKPGLQLTWQTRLSERRNPSAQFVDQTLASASGAVSAARGNNRFTAGAGAYWSALDGNFNERSAALDLAWARTLGDAATVQAMVRAGPVRFESAQQLRDVDRLLYALTLHHQAGDRGGALTYSLLGGRDLAVNRVASPYSNTRLGGRITAAWPLANNIRAGLDLGLLAIDYNGNRDFFGSRRKDDQLVAALTLEIADWPVARWTLRPHLRYVNNDSTVELFDYDGYEIGLMLGRLPQ